MTQVTDYMVNTNLTLLSRSDYKIIRGQLSSKRLMVECFPVERRPTFPSPQLRLLLALTVSILVVLQCTATPDQTDFRIIYLSRSQVGSYKNQQPDSNCASRAAFATRFYL